MNKTLKAAGNRKVWNKVCFSIDKLWPRWSYLRGDLSMLINGLVIEQVNRTIWEQVLDSLDSKE